MEMTFNLGSDIQMDFSIEGGVPSPPTPAPAPVTVYSDWRPAFDSALTGSVTDNWEEVTNDD
jgi:hypothetical protein